MCLSASRRKRVNWKLSVGAAHFVPIVGDGLRAVPAVTGWFSQCLWRKRKRSCCRRNGTTHRSFPTFFIETMHHKLQFFDLLNQADMHIQFYWAWRGFPHHAKLVVSKEALEKSARTGSGRFWLSRKIFNWRNTLCISQLNICADGAKDSLSSRR